MAKVFVIFVVVAVIAGLSCGNPIDGIFGNGIEGKDAEIVDQNLQIDPVGNYEFNYKQSDLQERQETGQVAQNPETGNYTLDNVVGSYRYVRPDGLWQIVEYRADANGFAPRVTVEKYEGS